MADDVQGRLSPPSVKKTTPPGTTPAEGRRISYDQILGKPGVTPVAAGAAAALGTIGGGPAVAAQAGWVRMLDADGVPFWVPGWR